MNHASQTIQNLRAEYPNDARLQEALLAYERKLHVDEASARAASHLRQHALPSAAWGLFAYVGLALTLDVVTYLLMRFDDAFRYIGDPIGSGLALLAALGYGLLVYHRRTTGETPRATRGLAPATRATRALSMQR